MNYKIRPCSAADRSTLAEMIRQSFTDVAHRFGLTQENAPRHPSNCTIDWIQKDMDRGVQYFILEDNRLPVGCVACEHVGTGICYLERLAVLPGQRRQGYGKALAMHVLSVAERLGVRCVNIGIIAEQTELKRWYEGIGFVEGESRMFPHLPFRVMFLSYMMGQ